MTVHACVFTTLQKVLDVLDGLTDVDPALVPVGAVAAAEAGAAGAAAQEPAAKRQRVEGALGWCLHAVVTLGVASEPHGEGGGTCGPGFTFCLGSTNGQRPDAATAWHTTWWG